MFIKIDNDGYSLGSQRAQINGTQLPEAIDIIHHFEKQGYINDWKGDNDSGNMLPDATYFYLLTIDGSDKVYKGFVDLRR